MDNTTKQTALFFGFLTAAMTYASAQAAPVNGQTAAAPSALQNLDRGDVAARAQRGVNALKATTLSEPTRKAS